MRYRAKRGLVVPMPDRGHLPMPDSGEGVSVDETSPYFARLIADGDIVEAEGSSAPPVSSSRGSSPAGSPDPAPESSSQGSSPAGSTNLSKGAR